MYRLPGTQMNWMGYTRYCIPTYHTSMDNYDIYKANKKRLTALCTLMNEDKLKVNTYF